MGHPVILLDQSDGHIKATGYDGQEVDKLWGIVDEIQSTNSRAGRHQAVHHSTYRLLGSSSAEALCHLEEPVRVEAA